MMFCYYSLVQRIDECDSCACQLIPSPTELTQDEGDVLVVNLYKPVQHIPFAFLRPLFLVPSLPAQYWLPIVSTQ